MSGFYEGGYSGGGYSGGGGGNNTTGSGYNNNNYNSGGNNAFSGGIGSSSSYVQQQQTQPTGMQQQSSSTQQYNQQPQQQQQFQQQSQQPAPISSNAMDGAMNFWNPALTMAAQAAVTGKVGDSSAMMNVAESMGKDFLQKGWAKAIPGLERSMIGLRPYFAVDNGYVKRKMIKVLFPFIYRDWARQETMDQTTPDGRISYALPIHDQNAPDLYIPSMALLTYVLLCALCYGNAGKFDPEVLPDVLSKCLVSQILEVIAIRIGFYMMVAPVSILDLLSYTGYKYLGLSVNMLSGLTMGNFFGLGHRSYYFTYLWTATAVSYFILKVMANYIPRMTSAVGPKRQFMVLGFAGSQFATCWFVSQTKFLE